jgi:hypothetical protein
MPRAVRSKNVGEWSEVYALAYLLSNGGGFGADNQQQINHDLFYKVLAALFKQEVDGSDLTYKVNDKDVDISVDSRLIGSVSRTKLAKLAKELHSQLLIPHEGRAFALPKGDEVLNALMKTNASASSSSYSDIFLKIEDLRTKIPTPFIGFSIKSQLNAKSTLLNATAATNFKYEIVPKGRTAKGPIPRFGMSLKPDMKKLVDLGYKLKFVKIMNSTHQNNMDLVDSNLAGYMANLLFETTQHSNNHFSNIAESVYPPTEAGNKAVLLKLKQYLGYVMLGMTPTTPWSGQPNDFGGLIMVKQTGDVLFYYLYNMEDFQNFLYQNLKFEYGSRSRHNFGSPYKEGGKTFINLNLQLRFT